MTRPSWDDYFLAIACTVSARADCARKQHGAVIVSPEHRILATGYNGTPPGDKRSCWHGDCPRRDAAVGTNDYSNCIALHAEQNAIANAGNVRGATIYITGEPCNMCAKLIAAAGIVRTVYSS